MRITLIRATMIFTAPPPTMPVFMGADFTDSMDAVSMGMGGLEAVVSTAVDFAAEAFMVGAAEPVHSGLI